MERIRVYVITYNNERILPYFLRHYSFAQKITIIDDGSNDKTREIADGWAKDHPGQITWTSYEKETGGTLREDVHTRAKSICWKEAVGQADWVIVVDPDEFLYHQDLHNYLNACRIKGISIPVPTAFEMVTDVFPSADAEITQFATRGVQNDLYSKLVIFSPTQVTDINYGIGCHTANPGGHVVYSSDVPVPTCLGAVPGYPPLLLQQFFDSERKALPAKELKLLHCRFLGPDFIEQNWAMHRKRMSHVNLVNGWCRHAYISVDDQRYVFEQLKKDAVQVVGVGTMQPPTEPVETGEKPVCLLDNDKLAAVTTSLAQPHQVLVAVDKSPIKLNLIYHLGANMLNEIWRENVKQLCSRWRVFNNKKIIGITQGERVQPIDRIRQEFAKYVNINEIVWVVAQNNPFLNEVSTFYTSMEQVQSIDPNEITFFGHGKGTYNPNCVDTVASWRNNMYHTCLDYMPKIRRLMTQYAAVGSYRIRHDPLRRAHWQHPNLDEVLKAKAKWHFSGTFFWFRHDAVFSRPDWKFEHWNGWLVENYLGCYLPYESTYCLFNDEPQYNTYYAPGHPLRIFRHAEPWLWHQAPLHLEFSNAEASHPGKVRIGSAFNGHAVDIAIDHSVIANGFELFFEDNSVDSVEIDSEYWSPYMLPSILQEASRVCKPDAKITFTRTKK